LRRSSARTIFFAAFSAPISHGILNWFTSVIGVLMKPGQIVLT